MIHEDNGLIMCVSNIKDNQNRTVQNISDRQHDNVVKSKVCSVLLYFD